MPYQVPNGVLFNNLHKSHMPLGIIRLIFRFVALNVKINRAFIIIVIPFMDWMAKDEVGAINAYIQRHIEIDLPPKESTWINTANVFRAL